MDIHVTVQKVKDHLSEYLDRVVSQGDRLIIEDNGQAIAALIGKEALSELGEKQSQAKVDDDAAKEERYRQLLAEAGIEVTWPTGEPISIDDRPLIEIEGPPISEQIVSERR